MGSYNVDRASHASRIQALGAAISRRDWSSVERAHAEIRDAFDRPDIYDPETSSAPATLPTVAQIEPIEWLYEYHNGFEWLPNKTNTDPRIRKDPNAGAVRNVRVVIKAPSLAG